MKGLFALALMATVVGLAPGAATAEAVPHPQAPCWEGERSSTAPGETPSGMVIYMTDDQALPLRIEHRRDDIFEGGELRESYNYLDYHFDVEGRVFVARAYLDQPGEVGIRLREPVRSLNEAREAVGPAVLCYLQKRFGQIDVLASEGYVTLWPRP